MSSIISKRSHVWSLGGVHRKISPTAPSPSPKATHELEEEEEEGTKEKNRGLDIDLNVVPPEEEEEEEEKEKEIPIVVDSDSEEERKRRNRRWEAILDVGKMYYEENLDKKRGKFVNGTSELKGNGKKITSVIMKDFVVVRSTRKRAVAMPNKFRDSILEPEFVKRGSSSSSKSVSLKPKYR